MGIDTVDNEGEYSASVLFDGFARATGCVSPLNYPRYPTGSTLPSVCGSDR